MKPKNATTTQGSNMEERPAQPHAEALSKLVHERINKRQFIGSSAGESDGKEAPVVKKKFKTVGYLPGGVPINKPIEDESAGDLNLQASALASGRTKDVDAVEPTGAGLLTDDMMTVKKLLSAKPDDDSVKGLSSTEKAGFYCSVCRVLAKDYSTYLSHLGSRGHLKLTGQSLKAIEKSTLEKVQQKLCAVADPGNKEAVAVDPQQYLDRWKALEAEELEARERAKAEKKERKKLEKEKARHESKSLEEQLLEEDEELKLMKAAGFNFSAFGA